MEMAESGSHVASWWCVIVSSIMMSSGLMFETQGALVSKVSACAAQVDSGLINLMPLGHSQMPVLTSQFHGWSYSYKPCIGFNKPDNPYEGFGDTCLSVAICKYKEEKNRAYYYTLGFNQNATFLPDKSLPAAAAAADDDHDDDAEEEVEKKDSKTDNNLVKVVFEGFRSMKGKRTYIHLICDRKRTTPQQALFRVVTDLPRRGNVEAELHHLCCCPDGCPLHGIQPIVSSAAWTYNISGNETGNCYDQQRHRNIVSVLGFCSESKHPYIISEFTRGQVVKDLVKNSGEDLSWPQRVKMLSQVADGMAFLHSNKPPVLHRDLRCANLFLTNSEVMKICDFGIVKLTQPLRAKCKEEDCCCQGLYSACPPSVGWTAPEVLENPNALESDGSITIFCDVYSYAIVMWELVTGDDPFEEFHTVKEVIDHVIEGGRPELTDHMLPAYVELMQKLWVPSPEERLTFKQITVQLKDIVHHAKVFQKMLHSKQQTNVKTVSFSDVIKEST